MLTDGSAGSGRRRLTAAAAVLLLILAVFSASADTAEPGRKLTLMVYLCGSNLESEYGSASADLREMMAAQADPQKVSVLVMAGGSSFWRTGFDSRQTSILEIGKMNSRQVWSGEAQDMGDPETLAGFLRFGTERYPAEDYALILWNHGGGPLGGVCWDELFSMDSMTLSELTEALGEANLPRKLSWIGFDACLMGSAEVASAVSPYAEYMIASQETEPAKGWNYAFLNGLAEDGNGAETGRRIVDACFAEAETDDVMTLSCIDLSGMEALRQALDPFFAGWAERLTPESFPEIADLRFSALSFGEALRGLEEQDYDLVDLRDLVSRLSRDGSGEEVLQALDSAVVCSRATQEGASGLTVYHPFHNKEQYRATWRDSHARLGFSAGLSAYLEKFGQLLTGDVMADWSSLQAAVTEKEDGWIFSLPLTKEQQENCLGGQLLILGAADRVNGEYGTQATSLENGEKGETVYYPVSAAAAETNGNGQMTAACGSRSLYLTDEAGAPLAGPLTYQLGEDGITCFVHAVYSDRSGREDSAKDLEVMLGGVPDPDGSRLRIISRLGRDEATGTFTGRIPVREEDYTNLDFYLEGRVLPEDQANLPGFQAWEPAPRRTGSRGLRLPAQWELRFFDTQQSAAQLFAVFQVTDSQQNTHSSALIPLPNPNLEEIGIIPRLQEAEEYGLKIYLLRDTSPLDPGLNLIAEMTNRSEWKANFILDEILLNGTQAAVPAQHTPIYFSNMEPGETKVLSLHIPASALTGLSGVTSLSASLNVYLHQHTAANYIQKLEFATAQCSLEGIAAESGRVLAESRQEEILWQILSLEKKPDGSLRGLLRVENRSGENLEHFCRPAVNGLCIDNTEELLSVTVPAGAAGVLPFTVSGRTLLKTDLSIDGRSRWYWLAAEDLLARNGIGEIREIELIRTYGYSISGSVHLRLEEPFPLERIPEEAGSGELTLMTGEVEASLERALAADSGAGLRLILRNHTDENIFVQIYETMLNGQKLEGRLPHSVVVPAGGSTTCCTAVKAEEGMMADGPVREAGICFRVNDEWTSPEVRMVFGTGEDGSRYLSPADMTAEPVQWTRPELRFIRSGQRAGGTFDITAAAEFSIPNRYDTETGEWVTGEKMLRVTVSLENLSENTQFVTFKDLMVNSSVVTGVGFLVGSTEPGGRKEITLDIPLETLRGTDEIRGISWVMTWYDPDHFDKKTTAEVCLETEPCNIRDLAPGLGKPLASDDDGVLQWDLLGMEETESGMVELLLHVRNSSGEDLEEFCDAAVNGVFLKRFSLYLPAGTERTLKLKSRNRFAISNFEMEVAHAANEHGVYPFEQKLLQRRGVQRIGTVQIFSGMSVYTGQAGRRAVLEAESPLELSSGDFRGEEEDRYLLDQDENICLEIRRVLIGADGVALSMDLINRSSDPCQIEISRASLNGISCGILPSYASYPVPPGIRYPLNLMILTKGTNLEQGTQIREISLVWNETGEPAREAAVPILRDAPLGEAGGMEFCP